MGKDPAFLFYPSDYIGGTMGMTFEEKGAYMELLMMQFNRGHMTSHMIGQTVGPIWERIKCKFEKDKDGLYYNERLDLEKYRRKAFTASRKNNLKGLNQYSKSKKNKGHMTSHMENVNENRNIDSNEIKNEIIKRGKFEKPTNQEIEDYYFEKTGKESLMFSQKFLDYYDSNGWKVGKNQMKDWKAAVRTWITRDKTTIKNKSGLSNEYLQQVHKDLTS